MNIVWIYNQSYMNVIRVKLLLFLSAVILCGVLVSSCSNPPPPTPVINRIGLSNAITSAIKLLTASADLSSGGIYIDGSENTLIIAINAAQIVYADPTTTQDGITNAINALNVAVAKFKTQKVSQIDPANLVGLWTFNQIPSASIGALVKDDSGNGHDGTIKAGHAFWGGGIPTLATDRFGVAGKALHFDKGANIEIPFSSALNPPIMSISLWANVETNNVVPNNQCLVSLNRINCYEFNFQNADVNFNYNPAENPGGLVNLSNNISLARNFWWHIAITFGGGHARFYANGTLQKDIAIAGSIITQSQAINLVIGQDLPTNLYTLGTSDPFYLNSGGYFTGIIDEVRIYKSALTPLQVSSIYALEKP